MSVKSEKRVCNTVKENDCDNVEKFLNSLPHYYYEENNLHALLLMREKDFSRQKPKEAEKKLSIREQLAKKQPVKSPVKPSAKHKETER